ncbi:MAG: hypothetical protein EA348_04870 [Pseudomonadaceae bacterium]|nr:MAG: hypothetical protein EA348_04870 [Pseudomonadaceae bacterium]
MAFQFLPIIKVVAPYIAQVATAAIPAFTAKPDTAKSDPILAKQIEELQAAATQNAESIHLLAENLQTTIQGLEAAAIESRRQARLFKIWLGVSLGGSAIAVIVAGVALLN